MAELQDSDGLFTFRTSTNQGRYDTHNAIPAQTVEIVSVRVEMSNAAAALAAKVIYVDVPWLSSNHLIDGLPNLYLLPIPIGETAVTYSSFHIPLQLSQDIKETFNYRLLTSSGALVADLVDFCIQFRYKMSGLT